MGSKGSKAGKDSKVPDKPLELNKKDIEILTKNTGLTKEQIQGHFKAFLANNPDGKLDRAEFSKLYPQFRGEAVANLDEIANFIFTGFDSDNNGFLTFNEFLIGYVLTSKGDLTTKLTYAFELYDADNNGYLTAAEVKQVITGMLDLLGASKSGYNVDQIANECLDVLDTSNDNKVTKDEFVKGLTGNYQLRSLMSPFN